MAKLGSLFKKSQLGSLNANFQNCINSRWFLYIVFFLAASDLYIFAVNGELLYVALFVLIGFLSTFFSKNMTVILFIAMILTNILRFGKDIRVKEGMDDATGSGSISALGGTSKGSDITIPNLDDDEAGDFQFLDNTDTKISKKTTKKKAVAGSTKEPLIESIVSGGSPAASPSANSDALSKLDIADLAKALASPAALSPSASPASSSIALGASPAGTPSNKNSTGEIKNTIEGLDQDTANLLQKQKQLLENMENLKPLLTNAEKFLQNFNSNA
mgnify:CR=1 FL=1